MNMEIEFAQPSRSEAAVVADIPDVWADPPHSMDTLGAGSTGGFGELSSERLQKEFGSTDGFLQHLRQSTDSYFKSKSPGRSTDTYFAFGRSQDSFRSNSRSAPLLPAAHSTHTSNWYTSSFAGSDRTARRPSWRPLSDTWRQWENDPRMTGSISRHSQLRANADDGRIFMNGCVPHWGKDSNIRMRGCLEHELTWAYYRMQRHPDHPQRKEVGDPYLPQTDVTAEMRSGIGSKFQFWRDLKPPFIVAECEEADDCHPAHPDGRLWNVTYLCGIDYVKERMWGLKQDGGTFDNKITGIAKIRVPDNYPKRRPIHIVSWGHPSLNRREIPDEDGAIKSMVDPNTWMPIADELGIRADAPRLAACREASRRAMPRKGVEVPPMQKLLLGSHPSLPQLAAVEKNRDHNASEDVERGCSFGAKPKKRQHRIFTSAGGFVRYSG